MQTDRILVTGQFWERDFADLVHGIGSTAVFLTCQRIERMESLDQQVSLVLIAQAGRQTVSQALVDRIRNLVGPDVPIINLLGSWCEGQFRSGQPLTKVLPLYWHQWTGGVAQLISLAKQQDPARQPPTRLLGQTAVGVSALSHAQADFLIDALRFWGADGVWLEEREWQAQTVAPLRAIIVDADSYTANLQQRLAHLREQHAAVPLLILLNFPRKEEVVELQGEPQVVSVVSKPFDLAQLGRFLGCVTGVQLLSEPVAKPGPTTLRHRPLSSVSDPPLPAPGAVWET